MTVVRQFLAAIVAMSLAWVGSAGAAQAHMHEIDKDHGRTVHALISHADLDHHAVAHGHDHDDGASAGCADEGSPSDHEKGVFHVHALCFAALEAQYPSIARKLTAQSIQQPFLFVPLHTRSVTPADRPPRTSL